MPFDPKNFLKISKGLQKGQTEAHYRSSINRAYYGVFGHIRNSLGIVVLDGSVHQEVIRTLVNSVPISQKKAGKRLETLFKKRKEADYNHSKEVKDHNCQYCINQAEEIIKLFNDNDDD